MAKKEKGKGGGGKARQVRRELIHDRHGLGSLATGAILAVVVNLEAITKMQFIKDNWWARPALILLVGYMLRRKGGKWFRYGLALMAVGGYMLLRAWQVDQDKKNGKTTEAAGPEDVTQGDWVATPTGQQVFVPRTLGPGPVQTTGAAQSIADRIYAQAA
jgi:hypothetical protein